MNHCKHTFQLQVRLRIILLDYMDNDWIVMIPNSKWANLWGKMNSVCTLGQNCIYSHFFTIGPLGGIRRGGWFGDGEGILRFGVTGLITVLPS